MSTHLPGFQSFSGFLRNFELAKLATISMRVKSSYISSYMVIYTFDYNFGIETDLAKYLMESSFLVVF